MNVVIFGHVCIDKNIPENADEYTSAGSPAMFMAQVFHHLSGVSTSIASHHGSDFLPYLGGIEIYPQQPRGDQTLTYHNNMRTHPRIWKAFFRENSPPVELDEELIARVRSADVIIFAPLLPNFSISYIQDVVRAADRQALKVILPQGHLRDFNEEDTVVAREFKEADDVLSLMDFVILSDDDLPSAEEASRRWAERTGVIAIVTRGEKGATVVSRQGQVAVSTKPIPKESVVDSVAAGDIFAAGFIHSLSCLRNIEDWKIESAMAFANRLAGNSLFYTPDELELALRI